MQHKKNENLDRTTARQDSKMEPTKRAANCTSGKRISIHDRIRVMKCLILLLYAFLLPVSAVEAAGPESSQSKTAAVSEGEIEGGAAETDSTSENAGSTENGTGTVGEGETENGAETEGEGKTEGSTETGTETGGESETETGTENESGNSGEGETESGAGTETDEDGEIETETETETEFEEETQELPLEEEVVLLDAPMAATDEVTSAADLYKWGIEVTPGSVGFIITSVSDKNKLPSVLRLPDDIEDIKADVFRGCDGIEEVILPDLFTGARSGIFADCINLKKISFGRQFCISQPRAFTGCSSLQEIDLSRVESKSNLVKGTFDLGITDGSQCLEVLRLNHKLLDGKYANLFSDMPVKKLYVYDRETMHNGNFPMTDIYFTCRDVFVVLEDMGIRLDQLESTWTLLANSSFDDLWTWETTKWIHQEIVAKAYASDNLVAMSAETLWGVCFDESSAKSADFTGVLPLGTTGIMNYKNFVEFYEKSYSSGEFLWDFSTLTAINEIYNKLLYYFGVKSDELKEKSDNIVIVEQEVAQKSTNEVDSPYQLPDELTDVLENGGIENEPIELPSAAVFVLSGENSALEGPSTNGIPVQVEAIPDSSETPEPESEVKEPETDETNSEDEPETEGPNTNTKPETEESNTEQETEEPNINSEPEAGETDQEPEMDETNTETDVPQKETNVLPEDELLEKEELNLELINEEPVTEVMVTSTAVTSPADLRYWGIGFTMDSDGYHITNVFDKELLPSRLSLPEGVVSIEADVFKDCDRIVEIHMPKSLEYIHDGAFSECSSLNMITSGEGLKEIGKNAFQDCSNLKGLYLYMSKNLSVLGEKCFSSTGEQIVLRNIELNTKIAGKSVEGSFDNIAMKNLLIYDTETVYNGISDKAAYDIWMNVFRESDKFGWNLNSISSIDSGYGAYTWLIVNNQGSMNGTPVGDMVLNEMVAEYYANNMKLPEMDNDGLWDTCFGEKSSVNVNFAGILPEGESGIMSYTSFCDFYQKTSNITKYWSTWSEDTKNSLDAVLRKMIDDLSDRADVLARKEPVIITDDIVEEQTVVPVEPVVEETQTLTPIEPVAEELQILPPTEPETVTPSAAADSRPMETVDLNAEKGQNIVPIEEAQNIPPAEPVVEGMENVPPAELVIEETQDVPPAEPVVEEPQISAPIETAVPEPPIYVPAGAADPVTETNEVVEPVPADMILEEVPLHVHIPQETPDVLTEAEAAFRQMAEWGITASWNDTGDLVVVGVADASSMPSPEVLAEYGISVSGTGLNPGQIICVAN